MAKAKKSRSATNRSPQRAAMLRRITLHLSAILILSGLAGFGVDRLRIYVERDVTFPQHPPRVVLKDRPAWMSDALAIQIINSIKPSAPRSAFDRQLLIDTATTLAKNPWVRNVNQVRRVYGQRPADTLEIDCEYRAPIALIHWKDFYWLIDGDGVKLPEQFKSNQIPDLARGRDGQMNLRVIEGISEPPVESGNKWAGADVTAALDLVKLLYGRSFTEQISKVDVSNFDGRLDPNAAQISLITTFDTQIRWGRPINARDIFVEIPTSQKLAYLQQIDSQFHRVDAGRSWIDIRFDRITYPNADSIAQATAR